MRCILILRRKHLELQCLVDPDCCLAHDIHSCFDPAPPCEKPAIRGADHHCHVYDQAQCGLLSSGWDGKVLDCNEAFARMTGHGSREEMIGRSVIDFYADPAERRKVVEDLLRSAVVENVRLKLNRKTEDTLDVLLNAKLSRNGRGKPFEVQGTVLDFTEHCRLEGKLK